MDMPKSKAKKPNNLSLKNKLMPKRRPIPTQMTKAQVMNPATKKKNENEKIDKSLISE